MGQSGGQYHNSAQQVEGDMLAWLEEQGLFKFIDGE
ncbi:hypothetical protein Pan216_24300 [Planctomycetes bacterium Pan216]|uniref:Uncharacterized protein n=1 Tax=Kolteria novifilia TaxID=2527975 RepID=A0A518B3K1_9BACT|nr:hypothetical protein Pan216_24300 [Planctomycetes bacterium Pan216]